MNKILNVIGLFIVVVGILFELLPFFIAINKYTEKVDREESLKRQKCEFIIGIVLIVSGFILQIISLFLTDLNMKFVEYFKIDFKDKADSIIISIISSFIFWVLTFKISRTKVIFSKVLVKPNDTLTDIKKNYGFRIRYANIGHRDLIEVSVYAKLVIHNIERNHIFFLDVSSPGKEGFVTILSRFSIKNRKEGSYCRTMTLYPSDSLQHELSKKKYPKKIRKLAEKGKVQFKDIFDEYGVNVSIIICVYGNDRTTGARKMFQSKSYTMYDIEEGEFYGIKKINIPLLGSKKVKEDKISQIYKKNSV